jgi:seryl-tRNA synthetase
MYRQFAEKILEVIQKVNKFAKMYTDSLVSREMLIKTTMLLDMGTDCFHEEPEKYVAHPMGEKNLQNSHYVSLIQKLSKMICA